MNWIINTYSDVYATAMMSDSKGDRHAATANKLVSSKRPSLFGLFTKR